MTVRVVTSPPRHCTDCGGRIWSLTRQRIHTDYDPGRGRGHVDRCNGCDPEHRDPWELATTGGVSRRGAQRRAGR